MDKQSIFADFVHQVRKGRAFETVATGVGMPYRSEHLFNIPSFDFGHMDDIGHPDILIQSKRDELWGEWLKHCNMGTFRFPYPECAYIFHWRETRDQHEAINLMHIRQSHNGVFTIDVYSRNPRLYGTLSSWLKHPLTVRFSDKQIDTTRDIGDLMRFDFDDQECYKLDRQANFSKTILATLLLQRHPTDRKASTILERVNGGRERAGMPAIPATLTINYNKPLPEPAPHMEGGGGTRAPHERRGHYRRLRSGRVIPVRPCRIHEGGEPRTYRVRG